MTSLVEGHPSFQINLYDNQSKQKRLFVPISEGAPRFYVCGPTVYDSIHIGNARPLIVFDLLFRLLRYVYGQDNVTYVRNITDVDDKINQRAFEQNITIRELTDNTIKGFHTDVSDLGCLNPSHEPCATDYIGDIIRLIERLIERGFAYLQEGHVLFRVKAYEAYGQLSGCDLNDLVSGARVEVADYKEDPLDFVLWKPSDENTPGWDSPFGWGRPGWHIECSAMVSALLGETIDIHGGGIDLLFPHHENELAQSCAAHGCDKLAEIWMHNGFLRVEGEKMSKSLGNFVLVRDVIASHGGMAVRLAMMGTLYRQPIDWTMAALERAGRTLKRWHDIIGDVEASLPDREVVEALADDLNTPRMMARLHALADESKRDQSAVGVFAASLDLIGLDVKADLLKTNAIPSVDVAHVERMILDRETARLERDFARADQIRDALLALGVVIKDGKEGTTWDYAS